MIASINCALVVSIGWVLALCFHEFGHALTAYIGGDKSVKDKGYLTLNPLRYTDASLTLIFPLIILMIGGIALPGAAVYINHSALRNRFWQSAVSLAGPLFSLIALAIFVAPFYFNLVDNPDNWLWASIGVLTLFQTVALILNLLPLPPLDGFGIIEPWLPRSIRKAANNFGQYGIWILFAFLMLYAPANAALWRAAYTIDCDILNVPADSIDVGQDLFRTQRFMLAIFIFVVLALTRNKRSR